MSNPVNLALFGAGGIAWAWCRALAEVPEARLAGVWDVRPEAAEALVAEFGGTSYPTEGALLEDAQVEAVIVCSPNPYHCPQTLQAAQAGKHVLTEKPMAITVDDCDRMIAGCHEAGVLLMVGQALRFYPPFAGALDLARRGELGQVLGASMIRMGGPASPDHPRTWRDDETITGGWLLELNVHEIDYLQTLLGLPETVCASRSNLLQPATPRGYDLLNVTLRCPQGRQGHLLAGSIACGSLVHYAVFGEEMTVRWQDWGPQLLVTRRGQAEEELLELEPERGPMALQLAGFCQAVRGEGPVPVTGEEGRAAIATATMVRDAWEAAEAGDPSA